MKRHSLLPILLVLFLVACSSSTPTSPTPGTPSAPNTAKSELTFSFSEGKTPRAGELVTLEGSSNASLDKLSFYADGELLKADATSPYSAEWQAKEGDTVIKLVGERISENDLSYSRTVTVEAATGVNPVASFSMSAQEGYAPLEISFDAQASTDPDDEIVGYSWDFGDGSSARGVTPQHVFDTAGEFRVQLTVTDAKGQSDTAERQLTVNPFRGKRWSDPSSWDEGVPVAGDTVTIKVGETILLDSSPPELGGLRVQGELLFADEDINLTSDWIVVEGLLQAGTADEPYTNRATITLTGSDPNATTPFSTGIGVKAIGVLNGGSLELHGEPRVSWTQLSATARQGATSIRLENHDWRTGESIVIASTDFAFDQSEERVITSVDGDSVSFEEPLKFMHYGELQTFGGKTLDERAEVGLLSRNIVIQGDDTSAQNGLGGHIIARDNATLNLADIELTSMGQAGLMGRYPVHWHLMGDGARGSYLKNASVHHSFNRCVTIHGSNGVTLERNVAYDAPGHCFFLEDGFEVDNVFKENLGLLTRRPSKENALLKSDLDSQGPTTYWITHPDNTFEGNVAAGSAGSGFWFSLPEHPMGASAAGNEDVFNRNVPLKSFKGNKAHSSERDGLHIDSGPTGDADGSVGIGPYRPRTNPTDPKSSVTATFEDFTAYKNRDRGMWSRGNNHVFDTFMFADNSVGNIMASDKGFIRNSVYVGESANKGTPSELDVRYARVGADGRSLPRPTRPNLDIFGFGFYDGQVVIEDSYLTNFVPNEQRGAGALSIEHFTPFIWRTSNYASGLSFANNTERVNVPRYDYDPTGRGESGDTYRTAVFVDKDGSVSGKAGAHIVTNTSVVVNDNCQETDGLSGVQVCENNAYGALKLTFASTRTSVTLNTHKVWGTPRSPSKQFRTNLLMDKPYSVAVEGGIPAGEFSLFMQDGGGELLELAIPVSRAPTVKRNKTVLTPAASLAALRASTKTAYYYTDGTLHVRLEKNKIIYVSDF